MAFKFQTKFGSGWFAVEADDYDNFFADLSTVYGGDKADKIVSGIAAADPTAVPERAPASRPANGNAAAASSRPSGGGGGGGQQPPADWQENPPECAHGPRRPRQWQRGGKEQYTWFCPLGQDRRSEQCQPVDAVNGKEWGQK